MLTKIVETRILIDMKIKFLRRHMA